MARTLSFAVGGQDYAVTPTKVERSKLYGRTETVALDDDRNPCQLVMVDRSGTLVIPKGGTGLGSLTDDGTWVDRSELVPLSPDGDRLGIHASSYDAPVPLERTVTAEELLDVNVATVYQLDDTDPAFVDAIGQDVYAFDYYYRAGPTGSQAYLIASGGTVFMLLGQPAPFALIGLDAVADVLDEDEDEPELDDLDFSMM